MTRDLEKEFDELRRAFLKQRNSGRLTPFIAAANTATVATLGVTVDQIVDQLKDAGIIVR